MKVLVIICSDVFDTRYNDNVKTFYDALTSNAQLTKVDVCGISGRKDFENYSIPFKYKIVNNSRQFTKITQFVSSHKEELINDYKWFIKFRPEVMMLQSIDFAELQIGHINARARQYKGPKRIPHGASIDPISLPHVFPHEFKYCDTESHVVLDDMIYIFDDFTILSGGFDVVPDVGARQDEWFHSKIWANRGLRFNVLCLNLIFQKANYRSGNINC